MSKEIDYQKLRNELDEIVAQLDDVSLDVDQTTQLYERGTKIVAELEAYLKTAENKITKVKNSISK